MTLRNLYEGAVKELLNNDFQGASGDALPFSIRLAIDQIMSTDNASTDSKTWPDDVIRMLLAHKKMNLK